MSVTSKFNLLACACIASLLAGSAVAEAASKMRKMKHGDMDMPMMSADSTIAGWPKTPKDVAMKMIAKYGQPNEFTPTMLMWHGKAASRPTRRRCNSARRPAKPQMPTCRR